MISEKKIIRNKKIKADFKKKISLDDLSQKYNISKCTIRRIINKSVQYKPKATKLENLIIEHKYNLVIFLLGIICGLLIFGNLIGNGDGFGCVNFTQ